MQWPASTDYVQAIQNPNLCFENPDLKSGSPKMSSLFGFGEPTPVLYPGNFATVFEIESAGQSWAVKCFTRNVPDLQKRYEEIGKHLRSADLPFSVEFDYLERGIRINDRWYPVLKMSWVEGHLLNRFVTDQLGKPELLGELAKIWHKATNVLRDAKVAHGDLQHGNILLVPCPNGVELKLIDYDGMFVPKLRGLDASDAGHRNYQHPKMGSPTPFHLDVDRFSNLSIYAGLRCASVIPRQLWMDHTNEDNLLFSQKDFDAPAKSKLFRELWHIHTGDERALIGHLVFACQRSASSVPVLDELVTSSGVRPLQRAQLRQLESMFGPAKTTTVTPPAIPVTPPPIEVEAVAVPTPVEAEAVPVPIPDEDEIDELDTVSESDEPEHGWVKLATVAGVLMLGALVALGAIFFGTGSPGNTETAREVTLSSKGGSSFPGRTGEVRIALPEDLADRDKFHLALVDLPEGISAAPPKAWLRADDTEAVFQVGVQASTRPGKYTLLAKIYDGDHRVGSTPVAFEVTLPVVDVRLGSLPGSLRPGQKIDVPIQADLGGFEKNITFAAQGDDGVRANVVFRGEQLVLALSVGDSVGAGQGNINVRPMYDGKPVGPPSRLLYRVEPKVDIALAEPKKFDGSLFPGQKLLVPLTVDRHGYRGDVKLAIHEKQKFAGISAEVIEGPTPALQLVASKNIAFGSGAVTLIPVSNGHTIGKSIDLPFRVGLRASIRVEQKQYVFLPSKTIEIPFTLDAPQGVIDLKVATSWNPAREGLVAEVIMDAPSRVRITVDNMVEPGEGTLVLLPELRGRVIGEAVRLPYKILRTGLKHETKGVIAVAISPNGKQLATAGTDNNIRLWDMESGELQAILSAHGDWVSSVKFSPNGSQLVSGGYDGKVILWNLRKRRGSMPRQYHAGTVTNLAFTRDSTVLLSSSADNRIGLWNTKTTRKFGQIDGHRQPIRAIAVHPRKALCVTASEDRSLRVWDLKTRRRLFEPMVGHTASVVAVDYSPDGKTIASTGDDGQVILWDAETGRQIQQLGRHGGKATSIAFSPDGKWLATTANIPIRPRPRRVGGLIETGELKVWNVKMRTLARTFEDKDGSVMSVTWHPNGRMLVTGNVTPTDIVHTKVNRRRPVFTPFQGGPLAPGFVDQHVKFWVID